MNSFFFFSLLGGLAALYLWIGSRTSGASASADDYFLGGRRIGWFAMMLTMVATQLGGGTLIGAADQAYRLGWITLAYPLGVCGGLLLLGMGFGARLRQLELSTVAELFERRYGSRALRVGASLFSIVSLFLILVAQGIATREMLEFLGYNQPLLYCGFWLVVVVYTTMGGLRAVVYTDMVQAIFILGVLLFTFVFGQSNSVPVEQSAAGEAAVSWSSWLLMPLLFMFIEQDMGQRCFAAKSPRTVTLAAVSAALLVFMGTSVAIYFGVLASALGLEVPAGSSALLVFVSSTSGPMVTALFMCAVLMAIISTADSLLCSISSNVAIDLWRESRNVQLVTGVIGMVALLLSYLFESVVSMLILAYELSVCVMFVPVVMGVLLSRPRVEAAVASMLFGACGFLLFGSIPAVVLSGVGFWIGSSTSLLAFLRVRLLEPLERLRESV